VSLKCLAGLNRGTRRGREGREAERGKVETKRQWMVASPPTVMVMQNDISGKLKI